jgi:hypothetical protein
MNSFSKGFLRYLGVDDAVVSEYKLKTRTLSSVLGEYLPAGIAIDFMSIDVEGMEIEVLRSNDWLKYSPELF